jgi:hypothetical protein
VDLVSINDAPLLLRHRAIRGRLLYERDPLAVADLIEDTLRRYRDFALRLWKAGADGSKSPAQQTEALRACT